MSVRWSFHMVRYAGHAATTERFMVTPDGRLAWDRTDGDRERRCSGRVEPADHRRLVQTARAVVQGGGCRRDPPRRDMPSWSLGYEHGDEMNSCDVDRDGAAYLAFEQLKDGLIKQRCR